MIDIVSAPTGADLVIANSVAPKAANILSIQVGSLEYEPDLGIDLAFFLSDEFEFQNSSFRSYLIQVLANNGISVPVMREVISNLFSDLEIVVRGDENTTAKVAR